MANVSSIHTLAWIKYVFGDGQSGIKRNIGIDGVTRVATGRYRLLMNRGSDVGATLVDDGVAIPVISGAFKAAADFVTETTVEVQVHSLVTNGLADPSAGTRVIVLIFN